MTFDALNPTRFMVAGDTHGDTAHMQKLFKWCKRAGVNVIVQTGDFGFVFPEQVRKGNRYSSGGYSKVTHLDRLSRLATEAGISVCWLDGNHEDFDRMEHLGAYPHSESAVEVAENIYYLPRGFTWKWGGVRFMSVGGAYSIDEHRRIRFVSWWPQETIKSTDIYRIEAEMEELDEEVDVIFSHDAPEIPPKLDESLRRIPILGMPRDSGMGYKLDQASKSNRVALTTICEMVDPKMLIHGHYHHAYYDTWHNTATGRDVSIVGLGMNGQGVNSYIFFDTDTFKKDNTDHGRDVLC